MTATTWSRKTFTLEAKEHHGRNHEAGFQLHTRLPPVPKQTDQQPLPWPKASPFSPQHLPGGEGQPPQSPPASLTTNVSSDGEEEKVSHGPLPHKARIASSSRERPSHPSPLRTAIDVHKWPQGQLSVNRLPAWGGEPFSSSLSF